MYAAGISQGAIESLLLAGQNPGLLSGLLAINPIADFLAFYDATDQGDDVAGTFRLKNWHVLRKVLEGDFGGTPDQARAEYLVRSPILYSSALASLPLILYWAEDDELIGRGATHQGGLLAETIRKFQPKEFTEKRHSGGHGYSFYRVNLSTFQLSLFDREIFVESVKQLLSFTKP